MACQGFHEIDGLIADAPIAVGEQDEGLILLSDTGAPSGEEGF